MFWMLGCVDDVLVTVCGEGTIAVEGVCLAADAPADLGCAVVRDGRCLAEPPADDLAYLPFPAGSAVHIGQGYHGAFSHGGAGAFALDFPVEVGTGVVAARAGRVLTVVERHGGGCGDPSCAALANVVVIDHGDGTFATYAHLAHEGALVEVGELVGQGQPIALSGNTGFSTGPHLHFQVNDVFGQSQPVRFAEFLESTGGIAYGGEPVVSANAERPADPVGWSTCPADLFGWLGVMLDPGLPCAEVAGAEVYTGEVQVDGASALVTVFADGELHRFCAAGPRFTVEVPWDEIAERGQALFAVSAADPETCVSLRSTSIGAQVQVR